jgi:hypothetical protein
MNQLRRIHHRIALIAGLAGILALPAWFAGCDVDFSDVSQEPQSDTSSPEQSDLVIENDTLPDTRMGDSYSVHLYAHGGAPDSPHHWRIDSGVLPPGIRLEDSGMLLGAAKQTGEFEFTVQAWDGENRRAGVRKKFTIRVTSTLMLSWKSPAHVNGNRIEGSADVMNTTRDDVDLTFIVLAVAPNGRATAIGYQHFVLNPSLTPTTLPFGDTLPHGSYVIHVDAVGEVEAKKLIYRERLQTNGALQVAVGP